MDNLTIVVGGQAGSEGKGAVTARLARELAPEWTVRVGGPNAGHTVIGNGKKFALRQIPVAAVTSPDTQLVIAAGSEIDLEVLRYEVGMLEESGYAVRHRLLIDREATVIDRFQAEAEAAIRTGTTGKGIGAARADRAMRKAKRVADLPEPNDLMAVDTQEVLREAVRGGAPILLEGTQGYVLGSHAGCYPYCTSGDCRASDFLAAAGLPPMDAKIWVVLRSFPIRIAGDSGPLANETTWHDLGLEPEFTTVTKKMRRVGHWDWDWAKQSVEANANSAAPSIALTFADYWWPELAGKDGFIGVAPEEAVDLNEEVVRRIRTIEAECGALVKMLGTGPDTQLLIK